MVNDIADAQVKPDERDGSVEGEGFVGLALLYTGVYMHLWVLRSVLCFAAVYIWLNRHEAVFVDELRVTQEIAVRRDESGDVAYLEAVAISDAV